MTQPKKFKLGISNILKNNIKFYLLLLKLKKGYQKLTHASFLAVFFKNVPKTCLLETYMTAISSTDGIYENI